MSDSLNYHSFQPYTATLQRHVDSRYLLSASKTLDAQALFGLRGCKTEPAQLSGRML